jgi:ribosomal protein L24E
MSLTSFLWAFAQILGMFAPKCKNCGKKCSTSRAVALEVIETNEKLSFCSRKCGREYCKRNKIISPR